jgi:hypothetical protein
LNLAGKFKGAAPGCDLLAGDTDCEVRAVAGDVNGSGAEE